MKPCLILGSGRSGSSLLAGSLVAAGYWPGSNPYPGRLSNPNGFFETREINDINEGILELSGAASWSWGTRWLVELEAGAMMTHNPGLLLKIRKELQPGRPFCYKDPRFAYTLPVWRPFLPPETVFLCIFRHPVAIAASILQECTESAALSGLHMTQERAFAVIEAAYKSILTSYYPHTASWFFVHYQQLIEKTAFAPLSDFLKVPISSALVDPKMSRPFSGIMPASLEKLYQQLCELAHYQPVYQAFSLPSISVLSFVEPDQIPLVPRLLQDVASQRGVQVELILIDQTTGFPIPESPVPIRRVPATGLSTSAALEEGFWACSHPLIAFWDISSRALPSRLAHQAELLLQQPGIDLVTCSFQPVSNEGVFIGSSAASTEHIEITALFRSSIQEQLVAMVAGTSTRPLERVAWLRRPLVTLGP
jgi:hypothetical protein